ncbi:MAG: KUP/HAK/KT family potassium transporter, partial [Bryobacteraceae bacterium]|nr:KUP/HAK/KT family potassium transporter [Bryobacteraceae bacterium]
MPAEHATAPPPQSAEGISRPSSPGAHAGAIGLTLGALGIVFGDIGTSPLYTLKECLHASGGKAVSEPDLFGILSLMSWSLFLVVTVKYLTFVMKADHKGEGGIFALLALVPDKLRADPVKSGRVTGISLLAVIGAALLYGDGVITPAISVLSAVEGLTIANKALQPAVIPITCAILLGLFAIQRRGTGTVGSFFGPVMLVWFFTLATLGVVHILQKPEVLQALSPWWGINFFATHGLQGGLILGSVVLTVTGGEALYADMGHFGIAPIRRGWYFLVFPALLVSYMGQGALVLARPEAAENPFYSMVPEGAATIALVVLSSMATVIASQALISGAFSLTRQAMALGYFPQVTIRHTASHTEGQIYIPEMNALLAVACLLLVLTFRESVKLAAAYGIAVTGTMAITSILFYVVARHH